MVLDENILNKANRKVVIDHHRRGESFISNLRLYGTLQVQLQNLSQSY